MSIKLLRTCDRCYADFSENTDEVWIRIHAIKTNNLDRIFSSEYLQNIDGIDLCPTCTMLFKKFIEREEKL